MRAERTMEINGIAHVILTSSRFAAAREFYGKLLPFLGMTAVVDIPEYFYCVGGRTALGIRPCAEVHRDQRFVQERVGLHHFCFRARNREGVDEAHAFLVAMGATIVHPPQEEPW